MYIEEYDVQKLYKLVNTEFRDYLLVGKCIRKNRSGMKVSIPAGTTLWRQGDLGD
jgi:hypothetical protein